MLTSPYSFNPHFDSPSDDFLFPKLEIEIGRNWKIFDISESCCDRL